MGFRPHRGLFLFGSAKYAFGRLNKIRRNLLWINALDIEYGVCYSIIIHYEVDPCADSSAPGAFSFWLLIANFSRRLSR